ncbi:MAG: transglutaminase [Flavobacteriaceae bacterium]|nr:transglutaminase [Flavobacteriaceae bacterium]
MKQLFFICLFFCFYANSQDFNSIDTKVRSYPSYLSAQKLAQKINTDFTTNRAKVRAIFTWLTAHVKYDLEAYNNPTSKRIRFTYRSEKEKQQKLQQIKNQIVDETFQTKKAVCEGYAQSFKRLCDLLAIEAVVIKGYARSNSADIGVIPTKTNHAWNAVKIGTQWKLIDATWATGYAINHQWKKHFNDYYFFTKPTELLRSHLPEHAAWQLTKTTLTKKDFANQPLIGQGFFMNKLTLLTPKKGVITKTGNVTFKLKGLSKNDIIGYAFKDTPYGKKAHVTFNNTIGSFVVNIPKKRNNALYLFINNEVALEYKIR